MKLFMKDFEVSLVNDNMQEFFVNFAGPKDSLYEGGLWKIHVQLPDEYPYRSITFLIDIWLHLSERISYTIIGC